MVTASAPAAEDEGLSAENEYCPLLEDGGEVRWPWRLGCIADELP
jgi:hypothetical protein